MPYTEDQVQAVHQLPLRRDVRWIDMSRVAPGVIMEADKRQFDPDNPADPAVGKWASVNVRSAELAAMIVECHNEWLAAQPKGA